MQFTGGLVQEISARENISKRYSMTRLGEMPARDTARLWLRFLVRRYLSLLSTIPFDANRACLFSPSLPLGVLLLTAQLFSLAVFLLSSGKSPRIGFNPLYLKNSLKSFPSVTWSLTRQRMLKVEDIILRDLSALELGGSTKSRYLIKRLCWNAGSKKLGKSGKNGCAHTPSISQDFSKLLRIFNVAVNKTTSEKVTGDYSEVSDNTTEIMEALN